MTTAPSRRARITGAILSLPVAAACLFLAVSVSADNWDWHERGFVLACGLFPLLVVCSRQRAWVYWTAPVVFGLLAALAVFDVPARIRWS